MRLYKYRDLSSKTDMGLQYLDDILRTSNFWCSKPENLNDEEEFIWAPNYAPSVDTPTILALHWIGQGRNCNDAFLAAMKVVQYPHLLEEITKSTFQEMMNKCRNEVGISCFATDDSDHELMWNRYGGDHAGVCIELEVPNTLIGDQLYWVNYLIKKEIHIDILLRALDHAKEIYDLTFLTKNKISRNGEDWSMEKEIRFVAKRQNIPVKIDGSRITGIHIGYKLMEPVQKYILGLLQKYSFPNS